MNPARVIKAALLVTGLILTAALCLGAEAMPRRRSAISATPADRARAAELLARCHDDPDLFNTAVLNRPPYWWGQVEMARSIVRHRKTVAYTGNGVGKDYLAGGIVPWWLYTRHESLVIVTGPSQTLLGSVTWKEIRKALEGARFPMGAKTSVGVKASPQTVTLPGIGWQALGYSTTNVERASGQHNRRLFVLVEEASGVEPEVWDALESLKYHRLFAIGNPVRAEGRFVEMIRQADKDREAGVPDHKRVNAIQLPSTLSPHAELEESPFGMADKTWLESCFREYGEQSLWCASHIFARIPTISSEKLIPEAWLDLAVATPRAALPQNHPACGPRRISCDLGEGVGRDATCIIVRDNLSILEVVAGNAMGLPEAAAKIATLARKWNVAHDHISYDVLGIGREFRNHLAQVGILDAVGYAGSGDAKRRNQFYNIRSEAAWNLRTRLNPDWCPDPRSPVLKQYPFSIAPGPWWPLMRADLLALSYDLVGNQTRLTPKKALCDQLGRSPDRGDALIQSFYASAA